MGIVIGLGVFFKILNVIEVIGIVGMVLFVWFLGGIIIICVGLIVVEFVVVIFEIGGLMKYIEYIYGDFWGFLLGWV